MKRISRTLVLGLSSCLLLAATGCRQPERAEAAKTRECGGSQALQQRIEPRHAAFFEVEYGADHVLVSLPASEPGGRDSRLLLVRCGTVPPAMAADQVIEVPVRSAVTTSTTEVGHFDFLGVADRLVAHLGLNYISSAAQRQRVEQGRLVEAGDGSSLNLETMLELSPDLVLVDFTTAAELDAIAVLRSAGIAVAPVPSFRERSPLARAEWLLYTSLFFGREPQAIAWLDEVEAEYLALRDRVAAAVAEVAVADRPTVFTNGPFQQVWHMPGGGSYTAAFLKDAGAEYLWADEPSHRALPLDLEAVFERALNADFWIHPTQWRSLAEIEAADARLARLAAFRQRRVFVADVRQSEHGGNDFWESGAVRVDRILADLVAIFHPRLMPADHAMVYHRRLGDSWPELGSDSWPDSWLGEAAAP